jgi:hypothetical protein
MLPPVVLLLALGVASCQNTGATITQTPSAVQTDIAKLGELINLPFIPEAAIWQVGQKGQDTSGIGPGDWDLVAALTLDPVDSAALRQELDLLQPLGPVVVEPAMVRDWFPRDVSAAFVPAQGSDYLQLAVPRFEASRFARSPLANGYFFLTSEGTVLLHLFTT